MHLLLQAWERRPAALFAIQSSACPNCRQIGWKSSSALVFPRFGRFISSLCRLMSRWHFLSDLVRIQKARSPTIVKAAFTRANLHFVLQLTIRKKLVFPSIAQGKRRCELMSLTKSGIFSSRQIRIIRPPPEKETESSPVTVSRWTRIEKRRYRSPCFLITHNRYFFIVISLHTY